MAETESEVVSTSGFKVRPLSRVAKPAVEKAEREKQKADRVPSKVAASKPKRQHTRLRELTTELHDLEARLRLGGGLEKIEKQHKAHKLIARERIDLLLDKNSFRQEIGLLVAYDQYDGAAPAAGVVTTTGRVGGREVVVVANDATVKAGSWWPETVKKIQRA